MRILEVYWAIMSSVVLCTTKFRAGGTRGKPGGLRFVIIPHCSRAGHRVADSVRGPLVMLQAMKEEPPLNAKCKDKFLIQSTIITSDKETMSLAEIVRHCPAVRLCGVSCADLRISVGEYRLQRGRQGAPTEAPCNLPPSRGTDLGGGGRNSRPDLNS
jgi:hypothetical protein